MPARQPGRALRSAAAELTLFAEEDVQAILSELDVASRRRLTELLDGYRGGDLPARAATASPSAHRPDLASWLAERMSGGGEVRTWTMTPHASQTLVRIAADQGWTTSTARSEAGLRTPGLLARLGLR